MQTTHSSPPASIKQPSSKHCFACGVENPFGLKIAYYDNGVDEVHAVYRVPASFQGYPGLVHGGIIAAILDEAAGRTTLINDPLRLMMTLTLEVKYRQPVPIETELKIVGRIIKRRGRITQSAGEIYLPDGSIAVEALVTVIDPPQQLWSKDMDPAELGWRVYPDEVPS